MKTIKNQITLLGNLLAVFILGSTGCEYYTTKPYVVQAQTTEQKTAVENQQPKKSQDEAILPQPKPQDLQDEKLQGEEKPKAESPPAETPPAETPPAEIPQPEWQPPVSAFIPETPEPGEYQVMTPWVGQSMDTPKESKGPFWTTVAIGGIDGDGAKMACDADQAITSITAMVRDDATIEHLGPIGCTDINGIVSGTGTESEKDFGGGSSSQSISKASPRDLGLKFAFTGYAVYPCRPSDQEPLVVCGLRPFAKPLTSDGVVNAPVWLSTVIGRESTGLKNDDALREAVANHTNAWLDQETYVANCLDGWVLTGFTGRTGDLVDQLAGVCSPGTVSK